MCHQAHRSGTKAVLQATATSTSVNSGLQVLASPPAVSGEPTRQDPSELTLNWTPGDSELFCWPKSPKNDVFHESLSSMRAFLASKPAAPWERRPGYQQNHWRCGNVRPVPKAEQGFIRCVGLPTAKNNELPRILSANLRMGNWEQEILEVATLKPVSLHADMMHPKYICVTDQGHSPRSVRLEPLTAKLRAHCQGSTHGHEFIDWIQVDRPKVKVGDPKILR